MSESAYKLTNKLSYPWQNKDLNNSTLVSDTLGGTLYNLVFTLVQPSVPY